MFPQNSTASVASLEVVEVVAVVGTELLEAFDWHSCTLVHILSIKDLRKICRRYRTNSSYFMGILMKVEPFSLLGIENAPHKNGQELVEN
mmetsp:Transcript_43323/g.131818  ORF Transcript_43323/g.131818 Transcript_43323/m.131818 type:complete len:90 (-) Transcript_43323:227-496(-)